MQTGGLAAARFAEKRGFFLRCAAKALRDNEPDGSHPSQTQTGNLSAARYCGERGIRTPGGVTLNGFQDRRNRPLCHLSGLRVQIYGFILDCTSASARRLYFLPVVFSLCFLIFA